MLLVGPAVPLLAQAPDGVQDHRHLLDRVHRAAGLPVRLRHLGVPGAALDRDGGRQRAAARHPDLERGRLGNDAGVGADAVPCGGQAAGARRLLVGDGVHDRRRRRASRPGGRAPRSHRPCTRRRPSCRTRRARRGCRRESRPGSGRSSSALAGSDGTTSMWPFRSRLGPSAGARVAGGELRAAVEGKARRDLARAARRRPRLRLPDVDGGARPAQPLSEVCLEVGLRTGRVVRLPRGRVEADQRRRQLDQLLAPGGNLVEDALLQRHCRR